MITPADVGLQTVVLDGRGLAAELVGGKAAMLDRLVGLGARVPRGGVVTTVAYRSFVEHAGLGVHLDRLRETAPPAPPDLEAARDDIDRIFLEAPMPRRMADAIEDLVHRVARDTPVAVRSSATAEDLTTASFAGQYRTSLGVTPGDVVVAVRRCWASLWHPEPRAYRRFRGLDENDPAMAALVMPMLAPSAAGVLFTEDPNDPTSVRIEMVAGLGEALVSGAVTPQVVTVGRAELDAFPARPAELRELALTSVALEREIGAPLDIEWAIEGGDVHFLQARPITTARARRDEPDDGFDLVRPGVRYTTAGIGEMLPGVLSPRVWDVNSWLVEEGFRGLFAGLGADAQGLEDPHALIARVRGRAALDLDRMEQIVESVPGGSAAELEHQYFGDVIDPREAPDAAPHEGSRLVQGVRTLRARARAYRESEVVIQAIGRVLDTEPDPSRLDDGEVLALRGRVMHLACRAMEAEISVASTASASYRGLEMFLREHLDDVSATQVLQRLTASERTMHRGRRALDLDALAASLAADPELATALATDAWPDARAALDSSPAGRAYLEVLSQALRRAGSTSVFGGPAWDENPELVWPLLRVGRSRAAGHRGDRAEALAEVERRLAGGQRWRATRVLTGQLVDVRRRFLRREANDAAAFLERREHTKAALLMLGGTLRRIDQDLGRRLVAAGHLDDRGDVELVSGQELAAAIAGRPPPPALIERRRRRLDAARLERPLDRVFRGRPGPSPRRVIVGDLATGWPGSPGRYEGPARVVDTPRTAALRRGDVLVARTTDASWLPLFHVAGAVVVEHGGPLSHAAILARELGMPAVINVPGIVDRVREHPDTMLTVDGSTGEIGIHSVASGTASTRDAADDVPGRVTDASAGIAPVMRPPTVGDDDPDRLGVFITGLIGAGAVMSIAIGLTQAIGSARTQQRIGQRARSRAESLATATVRGYEPADVGGAALRPRSFYTWLATIAALAGVLALWTGDDYVEEPVTASTLWLFAFGLLGALTLWCVATIALVAAIRWPLVSATARRLSIPRVHEHRTPAQLIGGVHASLVAALLLAVLVIAWFIAEAEGQLLAVDKWIFDRVGAGTRDNWWHPDILGDVLQADLAFPLLGGTTLIVPVAILLTIATYRCRPLMFTYPLVISASGLLHVTLQHFVQRDRPDVGLKPGFDDSFPGGHANELTLILGLLPLVVYVLTRRTWVRIMMEVLGGLVLVVALADLVRIGDHWPTDNLAGALLGAAMVLVARGVVAAPTLHGRCHDCPTQRRVAREAGRST